MPHTRIIWTIWRAQVRTSAGTAFMTSNMTTNAKEPPTPKSRNSF
ncbi:UNVERIFIED_CONTAM: hypothetical protein GTU68_029508 [Idotea baltica]|nr:hypothetical protein [Idotea baltica]